MKLLLLASWLLADVVTLKTGGKVEGIAREEGRTVVVETGIGTITVSKNDVVSIAKSRSVLNDYYERYEKIKESKNAESFYELALWAQQNRVTRFVKELYRRAIGLNPNHEKARLALGYKIHEGRWLTKREINVAQGKVKFQGKWVKPEERDEILAARKKEKKEERELRRREKAERRERALESAYREGYFPQSRTYNYYSSPGYRYYSPGYPYYAYGHHSGGHHRHRGFTGGFGRRSGLGGRSIGGFRFGSGFGKR